MEKNHILDNKSPSLFDVPGTEAFASAVSVKFTRNDSSYYSVQDQIKNNNNC